MGPNRGAVESSRNVVWRWLKRFWKGLAYPIPKIYTLWGLSPTVFSEIQKTKFFSNIKRLRNGDFWGSKISYLSRILVVFHGWKCVVVIHLALGTFLNNTTQQNFVQLIELIKKITSTSYFVTIKGLQNFLKPNELPQHIFNCEKQPKFLRDMRFLSLKNHHFSGV